MFAWNRGNATVAQTSWNRDPAQGALGALRTETEQGYLVGTTPLRDGRWHHVAVVVGDEIVAFPEIDFDVYPDGIPNAPAIQFPAASAGDARDLARRLRGD